MTTWMTLDEARDALDVRAQTIYAYVSRGRIGVSPDPTDSRRSLYRAEDVKALLRRKETGRTRETLAATTLFDAEPSLPTAISTFSGGRPFYRGVDVVELAATATLEDAAQLRLDIDRDKAASLGVTFDAINQAISTGFGSAYVNDFPNAGRLQRVVVQADAAERMQPDDLLRLNAINASGQPVPLSAFTSARWITGPVQSIRYNGYPAMRIAGDASPGHSTGEAMAEMEKLAAQLPAGFGYEWTGQSREEKLSGSTAVILLGFSLLAVFLCLAALYESWSIPAAVLLVVPVGVLGALMGAWSRGFANDVYFKVGLITIIGLSAKNAVLIIEFAKDLQAQGRDVADAALQAVRLRFRPIIMTSLAFMLGVLPLAISRGAGSASQRAIGTGVMGGMAMATLVGVLFVPLFFVVVRKLFKGSRRQHDFDLAHSRSFRDGA